MSLLTRGDGASLCLLQDWSCCLYMESPLGPALGGKGRRDWHSGLCCPPPGWITSSASSTQEVHLQAHPAQKGQVTSAPLCSRRVCVCALAASQPPAMCPCLAGACRPVPPQPNPSLATAPEGPFPMVLGLRSVFGTCVSCSRVHDISPGDLEVMQV